ncbi:MAG: hypothetical protein EXQ81_06860 [Thermoleophilia bacterium]|nr:hypothetical protein [Thermoleophilia bacterium]
MRVAVIDIGSNTARLLVATVTTDGLIVPLATERTYLRLGSEIELTGTVGPEKIDQCALICEKYVRRCGELGSELTTVIVTAPGRQAASAAALTEAITRATGLPVRVLSAESEGRLAYAGAVAVAVAQTTRKLPEVVAVVDSGGGSTEIAVGTPALGATWVRSVDLGSLRLTRAYLHDDPPTARQIGAARDAVRDALSELSPPPAGLGVAVGGSARALGKMIGQQLDADTLDDTVTLLARGPAARATGSFRITVERAETLLAGALLLGETCRVLGMSLEIGRGGLREGAALELVAQEAARAA